MSDLTRDDVIEMLQGIFEEQRDMTDEERQAYYDMLRKKEVQNVFTVNPPKGVETPLKGDTTVFHKNSKITQEEGE